MTQTDYEGSEVVKEHKFIQVVVSGKLSTRIDYDELEIGDVIGEGSFGVVSRGRWRGNDVVRNLFSPFLALFLCI